MCTFCRVCYLDEIALRVNLFSSSFSLADQTRTRSRHLVESRTHDWKVVGSISGRSGEIIFFPGLIFLCRLLIGVRSTFVLPQWHVKDPGFQPKVRVTGYTETHKPLTQQSRSELSRSSVGTNRETSAHATRQGNFVHSRLSS